MRLWNCFAQDPTISPMQLSSIGFPALASALLLASAASSAGTSAPMLPPQEGGQQGAPAGGRLAAPGTNLGDAVMAIDGKPAAASRIPEGTDPAAAALWAKLVAALTPATTAAEPGGARSFELRFDGRIRSDTGANEYKAKFAYLEQGPGLVRAIMLGNGDRAKSIQTRGIGEGDRPEYWFKKLSGDTKSDWLELTRADHREDRAETDRWASISYDIARLTDPASFRIVNLQLRPIKQDSQRIQQGILDFENDQGVRLPDTDVNGIRRGPQTTLTDLAKGLVWLELATPDFKDLSQPKSKTKRQRDREREAGIGPQVRRLVFGIDPKTSRPQLVIVSPHRTDMPLQVGGSLLVQCTDWFLCGPEGKPKSQVPGRFMSYETEAMGLTEEQATGLHRRFSDTASADLYVLDKTDMDARLKRADFLPH